MPSNHARAFVLAVLLPLLGAACGDHAETTDGAGGDGGGSGGGSVSAVPAAELCNAAYDALIAQANRCCGASDAASTVSSLTQANVACPANVDAAIAAGTIRLDAEAVAQCASEMNALAASAPCQPSEPGRLDAPAICAAMIVGLIPEGEACEANAACEGPLVCIGLPGVCSPTPGEGELCEGGETLDDSALRRLYIPGTTKPSCAAGTLCTVDDALAALRCRVDFVGGMEGEACPCADDFYCHGEDETGTCRVRAPAGTVCNDAYTACAGQCDGTVCVAYCGSL